MADECTESYVEIYLVSKAFDDTINGFMLIDKCNVNTYDVTLFTAKRIFWYFLNRELDKYFIIIKYKIQCKI